MRMSESMLPERVRGRVARLFSGGFGFIEADGEQAVSADPHRRGIYFHALSLRAAGVQFDELRQGAVVEFALMEDQKGWKAVDVEVVEQGEGAGAARAKAKVGLRPDGTQPSARRIGEGRRRKSRPRKQGEF
jgi:cold shock CspA family protein